MGTTFTINGKAVDVQAEPDTPLLWVIRELVGLTGTKYGCGVAQCGACSVHVNGEVQRSCSLPLSAINIGQDDHNQTFLMLEVGAAALMFGISSAGLEEIGRTLLALSARESAKPS